MHKLDLRKQYGDLYNPSSKRVAVVDVPELQFLMVAGRIEPGKSPGTSPSFKQAMQALFGLAYTLKFMSKLRSDNPIDYSVMPLEAQWWVEHGRFDINQPDQFSWNAMIMQPDHITSEMFQEASAKYRLKNGIPKADELHLKKFHEGLCVQILHIGPYSTEPGTVQMMEAFGEQNGFRMQHTHHEIYLGNPLRTAPDKLKTILRHPVVTVQ